MARKKSGQRTDYRGRGSEVARNYRPRHSKPSKQQIKAAEAANAEIVDHFEIEGTADAVAPLKTSTGQYGRNDAHYTQPRRKKGRIALVIVLILVVLLIAGGIIAWAYYQDINKSFNINDEGVKAATVPVTNEPYWVLILGSDARPGEREDGEPTRSDVIILARVDEPNKQVTLVSIPRDTQVLINGSKEKINAAFSYGGAQQAIETIGTYAGVPISHYVEIYFDGFSELVDTLGGIDVDVPEYAEYGGVEIQPGPQHLDGEHALTLARVRKSYATGDFRRTECQRLLVQAIAKKILGMSPTQIPETLRSLAKCFSTDMAIDEVVGLASNMRGMDTGDMYMVMAPSTADTENGVSYTFSYYYQWKVIMDRAKQGIDPSLDEGEQDICGWQSTQTLGQPDMTIPIPESMQAQLDAYQVEKKQAADEERLSQEEQYSQLYESQVNEFVGKIFKKAA